MRLSMDSGGPEEKLSRSCSLISKQVTVLAKASSMETPKSCCKMHACVTVTARPPLI